MEINQENLNYLKNKFHSKSSQGELIIPSSNDWVLFSFPKDSDTSFLKVDSCKKLRQFCQFFQCYVWVFLWSVVSETGLSLWFCQFSREMY